MIVNGLRTFAVALAFGLVTASAFAHPGGHGPKPAGSVKAACCATTTAAAPKASGCCEKHAAGQEQECCAKHARGEKQACCEKTAQVAAVKAPCCANDKGTGDHACATGATAAAGCSGNKSECASKAKFNSEDPAARGQLSPSMQNLMGKVDELRRRRAQ